MRITKNAISKFAAYAVVWLSLPGCVQPVAETSATTTPTSSTFHLNDTGLSSYLTYLSDTDFPTRALNTTAPTPDTTTTSPSGLPGQDAAHGSDAAIDKTDTDGASGFKFTKLDSGGIALPNQTATYGLTPWTCVYDQITGLTWEVKTTSGLQHSIHNFTWYNSNSVTNGGNTGSIGDATTCTGLTYCNTEEFVKAINTLNLCGYNDWRMPTREELRSLIDYSKAARKMMIDENFFPNTLAKDHWAAETAYYQGEQNSYAWEIHFNNGESEGHLKSSKNIAVMVVRGPS